jgi:hypothetical protein
MAARHPVWSAIHRRGYGSGLYLENDKPKLAADPFIIQNTEFYCRSNTRITLAEMAKARSDAGY